MAIADLPEALTMYGDEQESRNGTVIALRQPIMVGFTDPWQRVLLCPYRRSNPFLMLIDGLSILTNVNLLSPFTKFLPRYADYSDDGTTIRAHYGRRLSFQLDLIVRMLEREPNSRRAVLQIWNSNADLGINSKDIPCNLMVIPRIVDHGGNQGPVLDLTVVNRSNDLYWGLLGANVVQFSFLQEFLAERLMVPMGVLTHVSTNLHVYTGFGPGASPDVAKFGSMNLDYPPKRYELGDNIRHEVGLMMMALDRKLPPPLFTSPFMEQVVAPMLDAWERRSAKHLPDTVDWFVAAKMWFKEV
jgi:hypothetical protein